MEGLDKLKRERKQVRRLFTKAYNELEDLLNNEELPFSSKETHMKASFSAIEGKIDNLMVLDVEIKNLLIVGDTDDTQLDVEYDSQEEYQKKWVFIKAKYEKMLNASTSSKNGELVSQRHKRYFHLPKLELQLFDGNVKNWIGFWGQFKKVHEDKEIEPEDKFQYLIQSMTPGSSAREIVESFPPSGENYLKAIKQLKSRFARDEFLIEVYVRELLNLVLQQATKMNNMPLSSLSDKLETQLRALETLGVTSDKYAAMLYPLVESALTDETLKAWERYRTSNKIGLNEFKASTESVNSSNNVNYLQLLLNFLRSEVESEERLTLARTSFAVDRDLISKDNHTRKPKGQPRTQREFEKGLPTASTILATDSSVAVSRPTCLFCSKGNHSIQDCAGLQKLTLKEKREFITKKGACFSCLKIGHTSKKCKVYVSCAICKRKHYSLMCPNLDNLHQSEATNKENVCSIGVNEKSESLISNQNKETLLQTLVVRTSGLGQKQSLPVRALLDSGSQRSYISKDCVDQLHLTKTGEETIIHGLFGGIETKQTPHNLYQVEVSDLKGTVSFPVNVLDQEKICNYVPRLDSSKYSSILRSKRIHLSDVGRETSDIKLLLGADVLGQLLTGTLERLDESLVAVHTHLGWTVMGQYNGITKRSITSISCFVKMDISDLWRLDFLGINEPMEAKSKETLAADAMEHFKNTVTVNSESRYEVTLPWIEGHPELLDNRDMAEKRLYSVTKKLVKLGKFSEYDQVFAEWLNAGITEEVITESSSNIRPKHYLPHHAVVKEASITTKIRPVFDASALDCNGNSLNSCLEKGPNLIELIPSLLMKFRKQPIGVVADIKKAFLQISLSQNDRDVMRFLWWDDYASRKISYFRHCRVVFGVSSSPFLLSATLSHHLEKAPDILKETADILKESFYVDNCVTSLESEADLNRFVEESQILLSAAKFELRGWASNAALPEKIYKSENDHMFLSDTTVPVLGLLWDVNSDELYCNINSVNLFDKPITKRSLLSISHRLFDPIGFTCPFTLIPKLLLQEVWKLKLRWDDELPHDVLLQFDKWIEDLHYLTSCRIPRRFSDCIGPVLNISLHTFADASKLSYATCIFIRVKVGEHVSVQLVEAKARLAPTKPMTIPRLELMAALIASRLLVTVKSVLKIPDCKYYFWTDSMVALAWIKTKGNWSTFVGNRCNEISRLTNPDDWYHVPGVFNAADLPSRGCSGRHLAASKWWKGPDWLKDSEDQWPTSEITIQEEEVNQERRKSVVTSVSVEEPKFTEQLNNVNQYTKTVRVIGWIFRFFNNTKGNKTNGELNGSEVKNAETKLLRCIQSESFKELTLKNIKMQIFTDENNLLRVKSKLTLMDDVEDFKYPILLPSNHRMVVKLIIEKHSLHFHAGINTLVSILRQNFWILKCRNTVKKIVSRCSICKRHKVKPLQTPPPPLPLARVNDSKAFETTAVDIAGPLYLKEGPAIEVQAILNGSARLPCDTNPPLTNDSVLLVVWYQNDVKPVYSYDLRGKNAGKPNHWKDDILGERAYFRTVSEPATLSIEGIKESDEADYRCRVDFRKSPTRNYKVKLSVIALPQKPRIFDDRGSEVSFVAGPYEEGAEMKLTCKVSGGNPLPTVMWWSQTKLLESKDFLYSDSVKTNVLMVKKMDRSFLHRNYTCTASNNNISQPVEARVLIEMHLKPLSAKIISSVQPLSADRKYEIVCESVGSRPRAHITWWMDNKKLSQCTEKYSEDGNITTSTLIFSPSLLDHDKMLTCRAENDRVSAGEVEEDSWKLNVYFLPVLQLDLGSNMNPNDIEEGDDVYFECRVHANPAAYKVVWKHNNQIVQHNSKGGVIVNTHNLALQGVNRYQAGNYTCTASNVEGDGESNTVQLKVMYKPVCKSEQKRVYGVARQENARVLCEVDAVPKLDSFYWTFNNSAENSNITSSRYHSSLEHGVSTLEYTPLSDLDYGTVMCWGTNIAGRQKEPCVFHIIAAGRPDPPLNCTLMNQTTESLEIECIEGFDGGQPQYFQLEVYDHLTNILRANKSSVHANFTVNNLASGKLLRLVVYAFNSKGRSDPIVVEGTTLVPEKHTGLQTSFVFTPIIGVLLTAIAILIILSLIIAGLLRTRTNSRGSPPRPQVLAIKDKTALTLRSDVHDMYDDKNPDLIPCNKDSDYQLVPGMGTPTPGITNGITQDSAPPYEESIPPMHNIVISRNGDVYDNYKNRYAESHHNGDDITYAELCLPRPTSLLESNNGSCRIIRAGTLRKGEEPTIYAEIDHTRRAPLISPQPVTQSHREIVTVRTPLMASDQESCV